MDDHPTAAAPGWLRTHCPACGAMLSAHERRAGGWCQAVACRHRRAEQRRREAWRQSLLALRDAEADGPAQATAPVVEVRRRSDGLVPLPDERRERLRAHLAAIVAVAAAAPEPADEATPDTAAAAQDDPGPPLLGAVCARCAGYCCHAGAWREAFIDAALVRRVHRQLPGRSLEEVIAGYLEALPARHVVDSCSFHGERGCALPRDWRSDICNSFECSGLEQVRAHAARGVAVVYLVRRGEQLGVDAGFVAADPPPHSRRLRPDHPPFPPRRRRGRTPQSGA